MSPDRQDHLPDVRRRGDEDILLRKKIEALIKADPVVYLEDIQVKVKGGRVRLIGVVGTEAWRERLETLVSALPEVRSLETDLRLEKRLHMSPRQILARIQERLTEAFPYHRDISLDYQEGKLTISGRIDTLRQKMELEVWAVTLPDVRQVANKVKIGYDTIPDDQALRNKVLLAVSNIGQQDVSDQRVRVARGVVTLKGQASRSAEKEALLQAVAGVKGVKEIIDEITLDPRESDRTSLRQHIEQAFREDPRLEGSRVRFNLAGGTLFLQGEVRSADQMETIEEVLIGFPAVKRVVNELLLRR